MPKVIITIALLLITAAAVPPALIAQARAVRSSKPRVHLIQDMDNQPRFEAQHANETQRMKTELDRLAQSLRNARVEHESKLAAFAREEQEATKKLDAVRAEIMALTERFRESASNLAHAPGAD